MVERTARVAGPGLLALFAVLGALMTDRPGAVATACAAGAALIGALLEWWGLTGLPAVAGLTMPAAALVYLGHQNSANLAWMGLCVVAAWVALTSTPSIAVPVGAALAAVPVVEWTLDTAEPGWAAWFVGIAFTIVSTVFARRLRLTVEQLREAQAELAERSRAEERSRIAAEVHDVIGHALTVSLLHIASARLALDEEPAEARRALSEAERLTRTSLEEVRVTVGLMHGDAPDERAPLPTALEIPELVESYRRAGASIELEVSGDLGTVGATAGLAAYRIVQEALTNATKHAPGEPVAVRVRVADHRAAVTVGNGGAPDPAATDGSGLRGMRERAEGLGGRLTAGPTADGWRVEAVLPA